VLFVAGDPDFVPPASLQDMNNQCTRILSAIEDIRDTARSCLKPFPQQIIGMLVYGARKENKRICSDDAEKMKFVNYATCLRDPVNLNRLHSVMDEYIRTMEAVRDGADDQKQIPYVCCYYHYYTKNILPGAFKSICSDEAIEYVVSLWDRITEDSFNVMCNGHGQDSQKCNALLDQEPITPVQVRESLSLNLPLIDILTASDGV